MVKTTIINYELHQLEKVISGGQCGSDRGALDAAKELGIPTGGFAPKGYRTWYGYDLSLKDLGLVETESSGYQDRTRMNVEHSDGTLAIASNFDSPGEILTVKCARNAKKPILQLYPEEALLDSHRMVNFILENNIRILNVAGNRDYHDAPMPKLHHKTTFIAITNLINSLKG